MDHFVDRISQLSPKRLALLALDLKEQLEAANAATHEPIAVIGLGCRLPGQVSSPAAYWQLLRDGVDAITEVPPDRWDVEALYDPDPNTPGKVASRWGGFVDGIDRFDPGLFGIAPREVLSMDPQQRLLLEVGWETLEDAGYAPDRLAGSATGVFVGVSNSDYFQMLLAGDPVALDTYLATGNAHSVIAGRLSYVLGLQGPSLAVDTACSSSLVAVHLAIRSLRAGECRLALAGGVNAVLSPSTTMALSRAQMMAPDGRCKAFDARADGFVRAEGAGLVALKRLSDAVADGDRVLAVLRGSAVNQDGRSNGLTAPNGPAQVAVIRAALADADLAPTDVSYVESHGTGTALGDPIEARALGAALGPGRPADRPLMVGSVKTNVGHLESAAGIAGLIKVVLALRHGQIPPHLHFHTPSPHIAWDELPLTVPTRLTDWTTAGGSRIGGVSSFGFSGTNAHVILEQAPEPKPAPASPIERPQHLLVLSARSEVAVGELATRFEGALATTGPILADVAHTAAVGRAHQPHRLALVAPDAASAAEALRVWASGTRPPSVLTGHVGLTDATGVVFLFPGQGPQYTGMGRDLYRTQPTFRAAIDRCAELLRPLLERPLLDVLWPADDGDPTASALLDRTEYTQPAIFAIEYALAELWQSWGIVPAAVLGHSAGELVAACVAGVFSLEDGVRLVAARSRLMGSLPADSEMAAVRASADEVAAVLKPWSDRVSLAADNGPDRSVIAGRSSAVREVREILDARGIETRQLAISIAAHSPAMEPILDQFEAIARGLTYTAPRVDYISSLTGDVLPAAQVPDAAYWRRHLREPVRFASAVDALHRLGHRLLVEVGPRPTLLGMALDMPRGDSLVGVPSLRRGVDDWRQLLESLGTLYVHGVNVDWAGFDHDYPRRRVELPTYPFQREHFWVGQTRRPPPVARSDGHPLLGEQLRSPAIRDMIFASRIGAAAPAYLADHHVFGATVVPASFFVELALAAADARAVGQLELHDPLVLAEELERNLQVVVSGDQSFQVFSTAQDQDEAWKLHASGRLTAPLEAPPPIALDALRSRCTQHLEGASHYDRLRTIGIEFGPRFRGLTDVWTGETEALGRVELPAAITREAAAYRFHPALLDACCHILGAPRALSDSSDVFLLVGIEHISLHAPPGTQLWVHAEVRLAGETVRADLRVVDDDGRAVATLEGLLLKRATPASLLPAEVRAADDRIYEVQWEVQPGRAPAVAADEIAADLSSTFAELARSHGLEVYEEVLPALEALSGNLVVQAFRELGWPFSYTRPLTTEALAAQLGIADQHRALFERLLQILEEEQFVRRQDGAWLGQREPSASDPAAIAAALLSAYPSTRAEIMLTLRCGQALADVLRGRADPLQLLFPTGSLETAEALYVDSPFARTYNGLVAGAVARIVGRLSSDRATHVLEIGAGTGATTAAVREGLGTRRATYAFTDVSPLFLARARERFGAALDYRLLDIERDPVAQGFAPGSFDIVVAANVLHATADLRQTLAHVRSLLAPEGALVLVEGTHAQRWVDLTFGMTAGWWKFSDRELRPRSALLGADQWTHLLDELGFERSARAPGAGEHLAEVARQTLVMAGAPAKTPAAAAEWLVLPDRGSVGAALGDLLRARRQPHRFLGATSELPDQVVGPVVDLRALDAAEAADATGRALRLAQALAASRGARLWLATRGAQAAGDVDAIDADAAAVWGLGRVAALEHPDMWGGLIDLDPRDTPSQMARAIFEEVVEEGGEDQVALRDGKRLVPRLTRRKPPAASPIQLHTAAAYLVTGGLGGLGLEVARWMAEAGAGHLVLLGRTGLSGDADDPRAAAVRAIEAIGTRVSVVSADVADSAAMTDLFSRFGVSLPPLRGVVHAAAALGARPLRELDERDLADMLRPKVHGTRVLDALTTGHALDFFVLFSSTTALWGSRELAHYAAANTAMDALAHARRARGLPALSINWGVWERMRVASGAQQALVASFGLRPLPSAEALALMSRLAAEPGLSGVAVADVDWGVLKPAYEARRQRPFLSNVGGQVEDTPGPARQQQPALLERLASARPHEREEVVAEFVREHVVRALGLDPEYPLDPDQGLFELGMDSLMSVELKGHLQAAVGRPLPTTLTFNYPTLAALSGFLLTHVLAPAPPPAATTDAAEQPHEHERAAGDELSEDDVAELLAAKLARIR